MSYPSKSEALMDRLIRTPREQREALLRARRPDITDEGVQTVLADIEDRDPPTIVDALLAIARALESVAWSVKPMEERNLIVGMRQLDAHRAKEEAAKAATNGEAKS